MSENEITSFPPHIYTQRLQAAQKATADQDLDGLIIGVGADLAYLTGLWIDSHERLTALIVPKTGTPTLVVPAVEEASINLDQLDINLRGWVDGEDAHRLALDALNTDSPKKLAIGSSITADHLIPLQNLTGKDCAYFLANQLLKTLFMTKDEAELEQLRAAGAAIDRVHAQVPQLLIAGRTEAEVAADLTELILKEHAIVDFVIVGSGPNGANPHHSFSDRVLQPADIVVVDIGGTYGHGYHSDCTRTYIVGGDATQAPEEFLALYTVLQKAQKAACDYARPGVTASSVDAIAREIITDAGYGEDFIHRTGHGIGLSTHEEPFIMAGNDLVLTPGMAFSIEPGIYLSGKYGARIEDIVTITQDGCELLNNQPKDLR